MQANPGYTPDQIKEVLRSGANPISGATPQAQGEGVVNLVNAQNTAPTTVPQSYPPSTGTGTLEGSRGDAHLSLNGVTLSGEVDIMGKTFDSAAMATLEATGKSWAGGTWNGSDWAGSSWPAAPGPPRPGPARPGPAACGRARPGPPAPGPARPGAAPTSPARPGPA